MLDGRDTKEEIQAEGKRSKSINISETTLWLHYFICNSNVIFQRGYVRCWLFCVTYFTLFCFVLASHCGPVSDDIQYDNRSRSIVRGVWRESSSLVAHAWKEISFIKERSKNVNHRSTLDDCARSCHNEITIWHGLRIISGVFFVDNPTQRFQ